jgi:hypothetical protein
MKITEQFLAGVLFTIAVVSLCVLMWHRFEGVYTVLLIPVIFGFVFSSMLMSS